MITNMNVSLNTVPSKNDPSKKVSFLNVSGEVTMSMSASWLYVKGRKPILTKCVGKFKSGQGELVRKAAEEMYKVLLAEKNK